MLELGAFHPDFVDSTPIWCYVLKEAEVFEAGARLGPVGGRLVAEVFIGVIQADPDAFVNVEPSFTPTLAPAVAGGPGLPRPRTWRVAIHWLLNRRASRSSRHTDEVAGHGS